MVLYGKEVGFLVVLYGKVSFLVVLYGKEVGFLVVLYGNVGFLVVLWRFYKCFIWFL